MAHGVATIYQEFSLVPTLTVAENIFLGRPVRRSGRGLIDWNADAAADHFQSSQELAIQIDPDAIVRQLSVAEQQLVEIAKAISLDHRLLIMDEPTAALGLDETRRLLELIRRLAAQGKAILYISHRLDEVFRDRRPCHGAQRRPAGGDQSAIGELQMNDVVRMMVGVDIEQHYPKERNSRPELCLQVEDLSTAQRGQWRQLHGQGGRGLRPGRDGRLRPDGDRQALYRARSASRPARCACDGKRLGFNTPTEAIAAGVGLIPENRKADGLFFNFEGPPNITISRLKATAPRVFLEPARGAQDRCRSM